MIRRWLREPTEAMIATARVKPGDRVLDVAAGAGDQSLDLAERVGPEGRVVATDISPAIIARLRERAALGGMERVEARVADASAPLPPQERFDAAVCRLGLMLLPSRNAASPPLPPCSSPGLASARWSSPDPRTIPASAS